MICKSINYHTILSDECSDVIALHRQVFPHQEVVRSIYACRGVARYLASLIAFPKWQREHMLWGAWVRDRLVGYAYFRALPGVFHLNNIAISPEYQGRDIGDALWAYFIQTARERGYRQVSLDVASENERALRWYRRKGLRITATTWVYEKPVQRTAYNIEAVKLLDWEQAEAWQMAYGFSHFRLVYGEKCWTIGRLGKDYYRLDQLLPAEVEGILAHIDSSRRLLLNSSKRIAASSPWSKVDVSFRMYGEVGRDTYDDSGFPKAGRDGHGGRSAS